MSRLETLYGHNPPSDLPWTVVESYREWTPIATIKITVGAGGGTGAVGVQAMGYSQ